MSIFSMMKGLVLGAGFMYFYDPDRGLARRTLVHEQLLELRRDFEEVVDNGLRDLQQSGRELNAEIMSKLRPEQTSDWLIEHRVRDGLHWNGLHTQAVDVSVQNGEVILTGAALADEVQDLIRKASAVPGVRAVANQLETHEHSEEIPVLSETGSTASTGPLSPGFRLIALVGGSLVFLMGLRRGGLLGWLQWMIGAAVAIGALKQDELQAWAQHQNQLDQALEEEQPI